MNKIQWFESKTPEEWKQYFFSKLPLSKQDKLDLEDYTMWVIAKAVIAESDQ